MRVLRPAGRGAHATNSAHPFRRMRNSRPTSFAARGTMEGIPPVVEEAAIHPAQEERAEEQQKRKRRSYDVAFKMEVVAYAQAHNKMKAARQFDIHRRCVQTWCKTKDKLEAASNAKRMRLAEPPSQAPAETLEVSITGITDDGEIVAALPVTCASVISNDVTEMGGAALALAAVKYPKNLL